MDPISILLGMFVAPLILFEKLSGKPWEKEEKGIVFGGCILWLFVFGFIWLLFNL